MPPALVNNLGHNSGAATGGTITLTLAAAIASGEVGVGVVSWFHATDTLSTVSSSGSVLGQTRSGSINTALIAVVGPVSSGTVITATFSGTGPSGRMIGMSSFSGLDTTSLTDGTFTSANGTGTSWNGGNASNATAGSLILGCGMWDGGADTTSTPNTGAGYSEAQDFGAGTGDNTTLVYKVASGTGVNTPGGTWLASSTWAGGGIALKAASGGATPANITATLAGVGTLSAVPHAGVTEVGVGAAATAVAGDVTAPYPTAPGAVVPGDLLICDISSRDNATILLPLEWVKKSESNNGAGLRKTLAYKRVVTGDTDTSVLVQHSVSSQVIARVHCIRGAVASGDPFSAFGGPTSVSAAATGTFPNVTPPGAGSLLFYSMAYQDDFSVAPAITNAQSLTLTERDSTEVSSVGSLSAPALRASNGTSSGTFSAVSSATATLPTGWAADDYAILVVQSNTGGVPMNVKHATQIWEQIMVRDDGSAGSVSYIFGRRLQAGDVDPTVAFFGASTGAWVMACFTGVSALRPWEARASAATTGTTAGVSTTTLGDARLLVAIVTRDPSTTGDSATAPSGMTRHVQQSTTDSLVAIASGPLVAQGSSTATWSGLLTGASGAALLALVPAGGEVRFLLNQDDVSGSTTANVQDIWGSIDAVSTSRVTYSATDGPTNGPYRRITVVDGDDFQGERAEIGSNEWRCGTMLNGATGLESWWATKHTFALIHKGMKTRTRYWLRLPSDFPTSPSADWQMIMQFKPAQPYITNNGFFTGLNVEGDLFAIRHGNDLSVIYGSLPVIVGRWVQIDHTCVWSDSETDGRLRWGIWDGGVFKLAYDGVAALLVQQTDNTDKFFAVNQPLPAHMRLGIYHNPVLAGSYIDVANIEHWAVP